MKLYQLIVALTRLQDGNTTNFDVQLDALGCQYGVTQTPIDSIYIRDGKIILEGEELIEG